MKDSEIITFIASRLVGFYGENKNIDYITRLRQIANQLEEEEGNKPEAHKGNSASYQMALEAILSVSRPYENTCHFDTLQSIAKAALNDAQ